MTLPANRDDQAPPWFQVVENLFWWCFLIWTLVGFWVMPFDIGPSWVRENVPFAALHEQIVSFLAISDAIWMVLAAGVVYFQTLRAEGAKRARLWAALIMIGSALAESVGAITGFPFGSYKYTDNMGWRVFGVLPFTIPLAWMVIVFAARRFLLNVLPDITRWQLALGIGLIALLTDLNLEFVAWKIRAYWIWYPFDRGPIPLWPPWQNYLSWFLLATLFGYLTHPTRISISKKIHVWRPPILLGLMNLLFLVTQLLRFR